jgi:ABC-type antimicrobial peptide transport system permease subunit
MGKAAEKLITILITLMALTAIINAISNVKAEENFKVLIKVVDSRGELIGNAKIYIYKITTQKTLSFYQKLTLESGSKEVTLPQGSYTIYAKADKPETPTIDYVIGYRSLDVHGNTELTITLIDAAEIRVYGECLDAKSDSKGRISIYSVPSVTGIEINGTRILDSFGEGAGSIPLEIDSNLILVPANMYVNVVAEVSYSAGAGRYVYTKKYNLTGGSIKLNAGDKLIIELQNVSLSESLIEVKDALNKTVKNIEKAEADGFYLSIYRSKIPYIEGLIINGEVSLKAKRYDECYSNLREAILTMENINSGIAQLYTEATGSAILIIIILAFASTIIGLVIFDKEVYSIIASAASYMALTYIFKLLYPGINALNQNTLNMYMAISYIAVTAIMTLPRHTREGEGASLISLISSIASIAKRNLKRRKLRSTLTIISIMIIVGGFIALTSVSTSESLTISSRIAGNEPEGIIVYRGVGDLKYSKFSAISEGIIESYSINLKSNEYSFKLESQAKLNPIEVAINPYTPQKLSIYGAIAFTNPSDPIIGEILKNLKGKLPSKSGEIALTMDAAKTLNVDIGGKIILINSGKTMTVTGILNNEFKFIVDYDDRTLTPGKLVMITGGEEVRIELMDCESSEIVMVSAEDAKTFTLLPARLYVKITDSEEAISLSKRIALSGDYIVKTVTSGRVYTMQYKSYMDIRGFEAMLTLAISISNVGIVMLASVYERRNEVTILSAIGLNPSHITAIFAFEAAIMGLIAGGLGYMIGLSFYKLSQTLNLTIEVYPKISSNWAIATIIVAGATAVIGAIPALKSSIIVTPSKLMRWKADYKPEGIEKPWEFMIPVRVMESEVESMIEYTMRKLKETTGVERLRREEGWNIRFSYRIGQGTIGSSGSTNHIKIYVEGGEVKIKLMVQPYGENLEKHAYEVAKLIREIMIRWRSGI